MLLRSIFIYCCFIFAAPAVWAQSVDQPPAEEQNETMLDTLKRMQIKREENEHKKLLEKAAHLKDDAQNLSQEARGAGGMLPRSAEKKLKDIEKSARQILSESGASADEPLDQPPADLNEALKQLVQAGEKLNENLAKTSRRVVSLSVVDESGKIIQLVKIIRGYLN